LIANRIAPRDRTNAGTCLASGPATTVLAATSCAKRFAQNAGVSSFLYPSTVPGRPRHASRRISTARSSLLPPRRSTAGIGRLVSMNAFASPYAEWYCSWLATPLPEPKYPMSPPCARMMRAARYTFAAEGLPEVSQKFAIAKPSFVRASIDIIEPPPPAPWNPTRPRPPPAAGSCAK
jgi:hypothetical protein